MPNALDRSFAILQILMVDNMCCVASLTSVMSYHKSNRRRGGRRLEQMYLEQLSESVIERET